MRSSVELRRLVGVVLLLWVWGVLLPAAMASDADSLPLPWMVGDISTPANGVGRLVLEFSAGKSATADSVSWQSMIFRASFPLHEHLLAELSVPFFNWRGPIGDEMFVRGNLQISLGGDLQLDDWLWFAAGLSAYLPTFEQTSDNIGIFQTDLRAAALSHLFFEPSFGMGANGSLAQFSLVRMNFAPVVVGIGESVFYVVESNMAAILLDATVRVAVYENVGMVGTWGSLIDLAPSAKFVPQFLGVGAFSTVRDAHTVGLGVSYAGDSGEVAANVQVPIGSRYMEVQNPYLTLSFKLWLP